MAREILLVRHGHQGQFTDETPGPALTEKGITQALEARAQLVRVKADLTRIASGGALRALQTAEIVGDPGAEIRREPLLDELPYGRLPYPQHRKVMDLGWIYDPDTEEWVPPNNHELTDEEYTYGQELVFPASLKRGREILAKLAEQSELAEQAEQFPETTWVSSNLVFLGVLAARIAERGEGEEINSQNLNMGMGEVRRVEL